MKSVDEFVRKDWTWPETLNGQIENYKELNDRIEDCLSRKEQYDKLISEEKNNEENGKLSFKEQWGLYSIVDNLIRKSSSNCTYLGVDLLDLRRRLKNVYKEVYDYVRIKDELRSLREEKHKILTEYITFNIFYKDFFNERCVDRHFFVKLEDELKCMCCGATTKDYPLSKEELDFLTLCAENQGILLKEVTKNDFPLLQVLMEEQDYYRSLREPLDVDNEYYLSIAEEQWLEDEAEIPHLRVQIRIAHLLDSQKYDSEDIKVTNPKYLSDEKSKKLLLEVEKELGRIQGIDSRFKDLMMEECKTAKYEILILSGAHIPTLLEQAQNEDEKVALTKAYYNISNQEFRDNSNYFDSRWDALSYDCITANPEINNRILQMKIRRK
ncbi:MAG: hypothetical protein VZS44_01420 [Bacilli bacterium]|nr:hypothetical protein [Bacilli bacterium]